MPAINGSFLGAGRYALVNTVDGLYIIYLGNSETEQALKKVRKMGTVWNVFYASNFDAFRIKREYFIRQYGNLKHVYVPPIYQVEEPSRYEDPMEEWYYEDGYFDEEGNFVLYDNDEDFWPFDPDEDPPPAGEAAEF